MKLNKWLKNSKAIFGHGFAYWAAVGWLSSYRDKNEELSLWNQENNYKSSDNSYNFPSLLTYALVLP